MDAQPSEEHSSLPTERRELGGTLPSQELFDDLMRGPRKQAQFFNDILSGQAGTSELTENQISSELNSYENDWMVKHLKKTTEDYQSLVLSSPENIPQRSELSFHIINQFIMPQWHRLLVSPKYPKMDAIDLNTAQIRLAMESAKIIALRNNFEQQDLYNDELRAFDAMIELLQMSIDGEIRNQPNLITVPHPEIGSQSQTADFLIFEPKDDGTFSKRDVQTADILDPSLAPGAVAVDLLQKLRVNTLSRRPEFQDKKVFHKLILSRKTAASFNLEQ